MNPPPSFLIFELPQHDVPQNNTFFIQILDSKETEIFFNEEIEKKMRFFF